MAYLFKFDTVEHGPKNYQKEIDDLVENASELVFVGWRSDTSIVPCEEYGKVKKVSVVEIFHGNANTLKGRVEHVNVVNDDIRNCYMNFKGCLIWQDGPEHLEINESKALLQEMKKYYDAIIIATPNGPYPQGALYGNEHERHLSEWYHKDYEEVGFKPTVMKDDDKFLIGYWSK